VLRSRGLYRLVHGLVAGVASIDARYSGRGSLFSAASTMTSMLRTAFKSRHLASPQHEQRICPWSTMRQRTGLPSSSNWPGSTRHGLVLSVMYMGVLIA